MKILLKYNSVTEWVDICLPIKSHWMDKMFNTEVWPGWLPVLDSLGFTMDTVYYGGKKNINNVLCRCLLGYWFLVVLIGNGYTRRLNVVLVQV